MQDRVSLSDHVVDVPLFPETLGRVPPKIPSPCRFSDGAEEAVVGVTVYGTYVVIRVTRTNNHREFWGKGNQLFVDAGDFPTLAATGLHSEKELNQMKTITGRTVAEITELGQPGRLSSAGFMNHNEDIVSVLRADNRLVAALGLTHPQLAMPLFHVWNAIRAQGRAGRLGMVNHLKYNRKNVFVRSGFTMGWQESLFADRIRATSYFLIWRSVRDAERAFLREKYKRITPSQMRELTRNLSHIATGEMLPYFIMRYGFYEGDTEWRTNPIAISFIFNLRSLQEIESAFPGKLSRILGKQLSSPIWPPLNRYQEMRKAWQAHFGIDPRQLA